MWPLLLKLFLLLLTAYAAGILAQLFRQSAIVGYLLAGSIVGTLLFNYATVASVAELGVALLLFSIGLEFSFQHLKSLGKDLLSGGALQVLMTLIIVTAIMRFFIPTSQAVVIGCAFAVSSTAIVLRVLLDNAQIDSNRGRMSLGILLVQDLAVVPLVLLVSLIGEASTLASIALRIGKVIAAAGGLVLVFYLMFYWIIPWLLKREGLFANRELMILLAILSAMGAIGSAHLVGLSPALGAFLAGMLLAESPFATQIRSDIDAIRTFFVVLFFTSIGMLLDLGWLATHLHLVLPATVVVFLIKVLIICFIFILLHVDNQVAIGTGITLGQVGEFAFVLVAAGRDGGIIGPELFTVAVSITTLSMFLAPYMVSYAEPLAEKLLVWMSKQPATTNVLQNEPTVCKKALIIGFGPAGKKVANNLKSMGVDPEIIELNPSAIESAAKEGVVIYLGDATRADVLDHAGIHDAAVVVVTVPDSRTAASMIRMVREMTPQVKIIARGRYHRHITLLEEAGASLVVDEEQMVGQGLATVTAEHLSETDIITMACRMIGKRPATDSATPETESNDPAPQTASTT
ncbi:sodium/hydrogen exchanger [Desulfosarcina variabilis str. Montpellier]|uniref:cation:proton antiporter n=1 Tax=Desulfosarcina variabilis TaxID=2300 RepID=UPI003AFB5616